MAGGLSMQHAWGKVEKQLADEVGLEADQLNWALMAGSIIGAELPGIGTRYESDDQDFTLTENIGERGGLDRNLQGLPFDVIDIALGYQGLPDSSVQTYLLDQGLGGDLTGHSLGTLTGNYLIGNGLAGHAYLFSLPVGNIAAPNATLTIGSGDMVNGGYIGNLFNPDTIVAPITPLEHPFEYYKAFIDAHPELYSVER